MPADELSPGGRIAIGGALAVAGIACIAFGIVTAVRGTAFSNDAWTALPLGLALSSMGGLIALAPGRGRARAVLAALVATGLALAFDWIAFAPGERVFTAGASAGGAAVQAQVGEREGRIAFGIGAVLLDLAALAFWVAAVRSPRSVG